MVKRVAVAVAAESSRATRGATVSEQEGIRARLACVREILASVADDVHVRRLCAEGSETEVWTLTEFVCGLYDDMQLADLIPEAVGANLLDADAATALVQFSDTLEQFLPHVEGLRDPEVLAHAGWPAVSAAAAEALSLLPQDSPPPCSPAG